MSAEVISWSTHKAAGGFEWQVYSFGYGRPQTVLKKGLLPTRARAAAKAKEWTRFLKANARSAGEDVA